jgi:hypothetical protein
MDDPKLARVLENLSQASACWFSSVRPDGRAHLAPIWHVWHEGRLFVVTQARSVRARNIAANPAVSVALPDPMNVVILEGTARPAPERRSEVQPLFAAKYNWDISSDSAYDLVVEVTPHKLIAWGADGEGHWRFGAGGLEASL